MQIFTDTDTDVTPEVAARYGYHLISMPYSVDGETVYPYKDFEVFDAKGFYDMLRSGVIPTTSALPEQEYRDYFEPVFKAGEDILYVHFSAAMTATFEGMNRIVDQLLKEYPERKFYAIDTKGITLGSYNIVCEIGQMAKDGHSAEEIVKWAEKEVDKFAIYFFADDLKFFKRSGRVSGLAAMMGTLVGVRPIIHMNSEGKMVSIGSERGRRRAMERLVATVRELGEDVKAHTVCIGHSDALPIAEEVAQMLKEEFGEDLAVEFVTVNPTAGSHCGPDGVGVSFHAKHR